MADNFDSAHRWLTWAFVGFTGLLWGDVLFKLRPKGLLDFDTQSVDPSVYRVLVAMAIFVLGACFVVSVARRQPHWPEATGSIFLAFFGFISAAVFAIGHVPRVYTIAHKELVAEIQQPVVGNSTVTTASIPDQAPPAAEPSDSPTVEQPKAPSSRKRQPAAVDEDEELLFDRIARWFKENTRPATPDERARLFGGH